MTSTHFKKYKKLLDALLPVLMNRDVHDEVYIYKDLPWTSQYVENIVQATANHLLVAAIDFGTTYSGWAFSFRHEFENDPTKVSAKNWTGGKLVSLKTPTCALIKPDGKTLAAFGYQAEDKYSELAGDEKHHRWYYSKRFKMMLFGKIGLQRKIMLEDSTKKKLPALNVFSLVIKHLKDDLWTMSKDRISGYLSYDDIHWVLTVPAIWNDSAKQFMREAAVKAGISDNRLSIALEPEAASLFCRHQPVEKMVGPEKMSLAKFQAGTKYLVLDAGGGTIDVTVHEVTPSGNLKELHKASGGDWGGTKVDDAFENFFISLVGGTVWNRFKTENMEDYIYIFREFEVKKREIGREGDEDKKITFRIPSAIGEIYNEETGLALKQQVPNKFSGQMTFTGDKIRVNQGIAKSFFKHAVDNTVSHLNEIMKQPNVRGVSAVVMVGGFSESSMLQSAVRKAFPGMKIVIPEESGLAVLKGAVIFGHCPSTIASRVCKYTYGISSNAEFIDGVHPERNRIRGTRGEFRCRNAFGVHVRKGQSITVGEFQSENVYGVSNATQTRMAFDIFMSNEENPVLVADPGCVKLGTLEIDMRDTKKGIDRTASARMSFSGTEIEVEIENKQTGKVHKTKVDFLG